MTERTVGKVARINNDREIVINRGIEHGVIEGSLFRIRSEPIDIKDPDSGANIGSISTVKVVVKVAEVGDKFCLARTYRTRRVKVSDARPGGAMHGSLTGSLSGMFQPPRPAVFESQVETLRIDPKYGSPLSGEESLVKVGDVAESLHVGEEEDMPTATVWK